MAEIEREVAEAMAQMSAEDLAELGGGVAAAGRGGPIPTSPGSETTGTVVGVAGEDVFLQFGDKLQGVMPRSQFGKNEAVDAGRRVDVVVERYDEENDLLLCTRQGLVQRATWTTLNPGMLVEGRISGMNKGGLEVDLKGIRAFLPASHVDIGHVKDISIYIGQTVRCEVLEVDRRARNVTLSRRKYLEKERAEQAEKLRAELEEGQVRKGVVGNVTEFGAFVDLGGVDGLIHISDLSWTPVKHVADVVSPGQEVEVKILKIDADRDRISLGLKQVTPDPWIGVEDRYPTGTALNVRVVRVADFGAFAELEAGVDGLIPVSEMSWGRVNRPSDVVSVGEVVPVVVIRVEPQRRRLALSMKQASADPWAGVLESFEKGSLASGRVTRLADFGAFVELAPGVEGMIHISELSDQRVRTCADVVQVGQEVETRVLDVDPEKRRIALSIKAVAAPAPEPGREAQAPARRPARKRPRRGGLSSDWAW
ncbi:MAG: S1 RNA-binding domain-containing protein [Phycisphaerales bacterium]|nr:MAG: S1 RNA-binding domain-containing protein [Phycisphaerales bacterium]